MALTVTVTANYFLSCPPFNFFLCMPGTIPGVSPYLGHGFACHCHGKLQGLYFFLCIPGAILWESPYLSYGFAGHHHDKMLGLLSAFQFFLFAFQARYHGSHRTWVIALPANATTKCLAGCWPWLLAQLDQL